MSQSQPESEKAAQQSVHCEFSSRLKIILFRNSPPEENARNEQKWYANDEEKEVYLSKIEL